MPAWTISVSNVLVSDESAPVDSRIAGLMMLNGVRVMPYRNVGLGSRRVIVTSRSPVASTLWMRLSGPKPSIRAP